jgi:hypothetical protein
VKPDCNLEQYLSGGMESIIKGALKKALKNPKKTALLMRYARAAKSA